MAAKAKTSTTSMFNKRPKVTNAKGWQSIHNYGLAFDIVLLYDNDGNGTFEEASWSMIRDFDKDSKADWMEVTNLFKSRGWEWGGDWKSFKDAPHFQMTFGFDWKVLKQRVDRDITITESGIV
jgi:peptidoglycan L-alanyl-D-glutamate endopeptidase CwlK